MIRTVPACFLVVFLLACGSAWAEPDPTGDISFQFNQWNIYDGSKCSIQFAKGSSPSLDTFVVLSSEPPIKDIRNIVLFDKSKAAKEIKILEEAKARNIPIGLLCRYNFQKGDIVVDGVKSGFYLFNCNGYLPSFIEAYKKK